MALYRTYRPATFAEVVGQEHVTEPLSRALDSGRINHAYLFSGPRGCGKTSSARILARSLNCAHGPTSTPCGTCGSCVALAPGGPGNLDVVELDAASHGGVDDTRDLRDRAFYAPAESRYRVFIIDEAHMVSAAGFNALLKIVEEPPEHLIFIFATTEPEKVLTTIRSRTHHYPFRLLAPPMMRGLLERICASEGVRVEPEVYPLVIRAGGGSPRDSLSILDQLLAGAGDDGVTYGRALSLLGVTDVALIDDAVSALAAGDSAALFGVVERVVDAGHDPRRFAIDLLDRLRDLILLQAVPDAAERGLVEAPGDLLARMTAVIDLLGPATLTRFAEVTHSALGEMRGTTSPRLLLEVMCARMLLPAASNDEASLLQRVETLERRPAAAVPAGVAPAGTASAGSAPGAGGSAGVAPGAVAPAGALAPAAPDPGAKFVRPSQRRAAETAPAAAPEVAPAPAAAPAPASAAPPARSAHPAPVAESGPVAQPVVSAHSAAQSAPAAQSGPAAQPGPVAQSGPAAQFGSAQAARPGPSPQPELPAQPGPPTQPADAAQSRPPVQPTQVAQPGLPAQPESEPVRRDQAAAPERPAAPRAAAVPAADRDPGRPAAPGAAPVREPARPVAGVPPSAPQRQAESARPVGPHDPRPPEPERQPVPEPAAPSAPGLTVAEVTARWPEIRAAVRRAQPVFEAMLSAATIQAVEAGTVVIGHPHAALVGRLSDERGIGVLNTAVTEVFGPGHQVRVVHGGGSGGPGPQHQAAVTPQQPRRQTFTRPSRPRAHDDAPPPPEYPPEPEEPSPAEPVPDELLTDEERDEMVAQAHDGAPEDRIDPGQVALELLKSELGARPVE